MMLKERMNMDLRLRNSEWVKHVILYNSATTKSSKVLPTGEVLSGGLKPCNN